MPHDPFNRRPPALVFAVLACNSFARRRGQEMAYKVYATGGSGPVGPWCIRCTLPISESERPQHIYFVNDPDGKLRELNGLYHAGCAEPYLSMSRIMNMNPWRC
jgi:hypothetical protein